MNKKRNIVELIKEDLDESNEILFDYEGQTNERIQDYESD